MRERERQRRLPIQRTQLRDLVLVDEHVVGPHQPPAEPAPRLHRALVQRGRHLAQIARGFDPYALGIAPELFGQRLEPFAEPIGIQQLGHRLRICTQRRSRFVD
jgi:hypothetical protein